MDNLIIDGGLSISGVVCSINVINMSIQDNIIVIKDKTDKIKELHERVKNLENQIYYTPGNLGYLEAEEHFNHISKKIN